MAAAQVIATNKGSQGSGTSHPINLPDGIQTGDLLVVGFSNGNSTFPGAGDAEGNSWTQYFLHNWLGGGGTPRLRLRQRTVDGTEGFTGTDDTVTFETGASTNSSHHSYLIRDFSSSQNPEASDGVEGTSDSPDPASITPTGGEKDYLFIEFAAAADKLASSASTNYTNLLTEQASLGAIGVSSARRTLTAASEDPDAMTLTASDEWIAVVTVIHPADVVTTQVMRPAADASNVDGWQDELGGTTDIWQSIDEVDPDDSDFIRSPV